MAQNFYIADTHFGHSNIISFDNRPFTSVQEMEKYMVDAWNGSVTPENTVYILGDFCWDTRASEWERLTSILHGKKVLVLGNHDKKRLPKTPGLFQEVCDYKQVADKGRAVMLSHYPHVVL